LYESQALAQISVELSKLGLVEESLSIARGISGEFRKSSALKEISVELSKHGDWVLAEKIGLEIPSISIRQECWKEIADMKVQISSWENALGSITLLDSQEAQRYYLKGWVNSISFLEVNADCVMRALPLLSNHSDSIKTLLGKYAIREIGLGNPSKVVTSRLNSTFGLNWLSDVTAHFQHSQASSSRSSNNLREWLHEIHDEDDRDQIELWAKQVAKGKISEEEFEKRLKGIE
jgi:hypothetical protein